MPVLDAWSLMARIASRRDRFHASSAIVESTSLLIVRNQLMLGVRNPTDLREVSEAIGADHMAAIIGALPTYELRRVLEKVAPESGASLSLEDARTALIGLALGEEKAKTVVNEVREERSVAPQRTLRRHKALGARRVRPG